MTPGSVLTVSHYTREHAADVRRQLLDVYAEVYAKEAAEDPFFSLPRFSARLDAHSPTAAGPVSSARWAIPPWAMPTVAPTRRRTGRTSPTPSADVSSFATGTFGLCELMVRKAWRGTGIARALHDELVQDRPEVRASLLVEETHPRVRATYRRWGYQVVGQLRPTADAPQYTAMVLDLA